MFEFVHGRALGFRGAHPQRFWKATCVFPLVEICLPLRAFLMSARYK